MLQQTPHVRALSYPLESELEEYIEAFVVPIRLAQCVLLIAPEICGVAKNPGCIVSAPAFSSERATPYSRRSNL